jgi:murein DD-endopeptidase MepM/ murein hydrolase activator NlpD
MPDHKYFLDHSDLQYKRIKLPWKRKVVRILMWFVVSVAVTILYNIIFDRLQGSPKEKLLTQEIEDLKLRYSILNREIAQNVKIIDNLQLSDENRYRPVLDMEIVPESYRSMGTGGTNKYEELEGFINTDMMISFRKKVDNLRNRAVVQTESFNSIEKTRDEWKREMEYLPMISPVNIIYRLGDGLRFREKHPVLGTPAWHHGQDFVTPYGTEVFATGSGKIIEAGWKGGFGNCIVIDHGYGYTSTYGHLSSIGVTVGMKVKRGDKIGLTGSTGTSSGPHLHYQIDLFGQHKNPLYYFNNDLTEDEYFEMIQTLTSQAKLR